MMKLLFGPRPPKKRCIVAISTKYYSCDACAIRPAAVPLSTDHPLPSAETSLFFKVCFCVHFACFWFTPWLEIDWKSIKCRCCKLFSVLLVLTAHFPTRFATHHPNCHSSNDPNTTWLHRKKKQCQTFRIFYLPAQHEIMYCQLPSPASSHWNLAFSYSWW